MDINKNMELENFELVIGRVSEGSNVDVDPMMITEEMAVKSIKNNIDNNRNLNTCFEHAVYDLVKTDLLPYVNDNVRGK